MTDEKLKQRILQARDLARTGYLSAPASFRNGNPELLFKVCNGCGAANAKFNFVPDTIYGTYIGYACMIHDWQYDQGRTIEDKESADRIFLNNMLRIINHENDWYKPTTLMRCRAKEYYIAVKYYGGPSFWVNKEMRV